MVSSKKQCEHGKRKDTCRLCSNSFCEHNRLKSTCKECGGSQICEHNKIRSRCKDCGGGSFCEHGKRRSCCNECGGGEICEHNKQRSRCKDCGGSQICEHNKNKHQCVECKGSQICEHGKRKTECKECEGNSVCPHGKYKYYCVECDGSGICSHGIRKSYCKQCQGSQICIHDKNRSLCPDCEGKRLCKSRGAPYNTGCLTTGNRKLNGYCSHCFVNLFPEDPKALSVRKKSKEIQVMTHIFSKYDGFKNDKPFYVDLQGGCCATKRRIDLRKLINNTMLCIEVDEDQHKKYIKDDERNRYDDLFMDFSGKYIFIRYNPDKFIDKYGKSKNPMFDTRMDVLEKSINKHIDRILNYENSEIIEIHHLFYNES